MNEVPILHEFSVYLPSKPPHSEQKISLRESSRFIANLPQCGHGGKPCPEFGSRFFRLHRRMTGRRGQPRFGLRTLGIRLGFARHLYGLRHSIVFGCPSIFYRESPILQRDNLSIDLFRCSDISLHGQEGGQGDSEVFFILDKKWF